jgi:pilus assembly protein Flp/PilA
MELRAHSLLSVKLKEISNMHRVFFAMQSFLTREEGQDLVEYALVVALIAFGAVAAMQGLATEINVAFQTISSDLSTSL